MLQIAENLQLPPEAMTLTSAILGIRGSGKTNTGVVFTEELLEQHQQVIVIDPLDVWWGLKSSGDGAAPGYAIVILGGAHGDLPLGASDGAAIADILVETRTPAILSLRHLRKGEQKKFVADFAEQLYQRKGETGNNTPCLVVIDEASSFVPQSFQGDSARMVGAIEDLVRRGRASGLGVMLIDQRAASVNKDVLTQLELLVAHRHTSPQDRAALKLWVQAHDTGEMEKTFMDSLASLPRGQAWFWSPGWLDVFERVTVRKRRTFDSSATPELGEAVAAPAAFASVDLEALRERLAATVEEAQNSDPVALRARVAQLETEAATRPVETKIERVEVPVLVEGEVERLETQAHDLIAMSKELHGLGADILSRLASLREDASSSEPEGVPVWLISRPPEPPGLEPIPEEPQAPKKPTKPLTEPKAKVQPTAPAVLGLPKPQQNILDTLAAFARVGMRDVARSNAAIWAGQSPKSSGFTNNLGSLRSGGLIDYPAPGRLALTEMGSQFSTPVRPLRSLAELHREWCNRLPAPQARIVRVLIEGHPRPILRGALAVASDQSPTSSGFTNNLGSLRSLGLLDYPQSGHVVATKLLFPEGLK